MSEESDKLATLVKQARYFEKIDELDEDFNKFRELMSAKILVMETEFNTFRSMVNTFNSIKKLLYGLVGAVLIAIGTNLANKLMGGN